MGKVYREKITDLNILKDVIEREWMRLDQRVIDGAIKQ
jgi:hypothetical protein